jgi:hypothetical protein
MTAVVVAFSGTARQGHRIDTGTDNPAPRRKAFNMGVFENRLFCTRLGPVIIDIAFAVSLHDLDELLEEELAGRVLEACKVLPFERRLDRVHDHDVVHVVDPEVAIAS